LATTTIGPNSVLAADTEVVSCELGGGAALLDLRSSTYYNVNAVGAYLWDQLQQPRKVADLEEAVMARYDIDSETCRRDVAVLVQQLADAKLVKVTDAPGS
jgi:hypothetical protein